MVISINFDVCFDGEILQIVNEQIYTICFLLTIRIVVGRFIYLAY